MIAFLCLVVGICFLPGSAYSADEAAPADTSSGPAPASTSSSPAPAKEAPADASGGKKDLTTKTFQGEALKLKAHMISLFDASSKVNDPSKRKEARSLIETSVDWDTISHECLGSNQWKKTPAGNRDQFSRLLREVIVKTAYSRLGNFWDGTTYKFEKIDVKGKDAVVKSKFMLKDEAVVLEYYMQRKGDKWMLTDIAYDDIKYSENINEQINSFLREGKFPGLLDKLKKRLEELDKDTEDNKAKS